MRSAGASELARPSRKSSFGDAHPTNPPSSVGPTHPSPKTYFLADESYVEATLSQAGLSNSPQNDRRDSTYGVQSLGDAGDPGVDGGERECDHPKDKLITPKDSRLDHEDYKPPPVDVETRFMSDTELLPSHPLSDRSHPPSRQTSQRMSRSTPSESLTPLLLPSPDPGSPFPNSPKSTSSFKPYDADSMAGDAESQAIVSSDEDGEQASGFRNDESPQLIMPSINIPSRRPFTDRGKNMGRLKVLVAGNSGVGKTSLVKSIVQTCEDIVHVDPFSPTLPSLDGRTPKKRPQHSSVGNNRRGTRLITEILASTKPYPAWWADFDDSKVLRRRKSLDGTVLERNICFVDTPGYGGQISYAESIDLVVGYVEAQYKKMLSLSELTDGEALGLLSGDGGSLVDVVLYLITEDITAVDIEFMRRLSSLTNVVPLIGKADTLSSDQVSSTKAAVLRELQNTNITPFFFGKSVREAMQDSQLPLPYAVASATANDSENMDASLLMSSGYVQPLVPSDLSLLIDRIVQNDTTSWLRHSAVRKLLSSRHRPLHSSSRSSSSPMGLSSTKVARSNYYHLTSPLTSPTLASSSSSSAVENASNSYALAKLADHKQSEEKLVQVRLARWASDLQRSLRNERVRFEALARGDRVVWLTERLGECVVDGTMIPKIAEDNMALVQRYSSRTSAGPLIKSGGSSNVPSLDPRDPLGILQWTERVKRKGWITLQVLGSFGIIGGLALWIARSRGSSEDRLWDWCRDWWCGVD
ncbi:MAG: hypothetical protein M1833_000612 [Piccolia ochrophora]|nr:MAG: hypothetical protein M1833_000612 [Piccolia ochrophora]